MAVAMNISKTKREASKAAAFRCGYCGYSAELPIEALGRKAKCPECGELSRIRTAIGAASEPKDQTKAGLFSCDHCDYATELPVETIGKKAKCPECGELSRVRSAEPQIMEETQMDEKTVPLRQENADVDSLAMSYLGRASTLASVRQDTIPLAPATRQHCPHCHQLMPLKAPAPKPAPQASAQPAAAPAQSPAAPAQSPAASTQGAPRPSALPSSRPASESPGKPATEPIMRCPFCREVILLAARKCKHCGEYLDDTLRCLSEPSNNNSRNNNRREGSTRNVPEDTGHRALRELWRRVGPVRLALAVLVVAGLGWAAVHFLGGRSGPAATPGAKGTIAAAEAGSGGPEDKSSSSAPKTALDKLAAKMEKQLQDTAIRSPDGGSLNFESSDKGIMPWGCETSGSDKSLKGSITVPYKLDRSEKHLPSSRGRYVLNFLFKKGQWELQLVQLETRVMINAGVETPVDDSGFAIQPDKNFAVMLFKRTLTKLAPAPADD